MLKKIIIGKFFGSYPDKSQVTKLLKMLTGGKFLLGSGTSLAAREVECQKGGFTLLFCKIGKRMTTDGKRFLSSAFGVLHRKSKLFQPPTEFQGSSAEECFVAGKPPGKGCWAQRFGSQVGRTAGSESFLCFR